MNQGENIVESVRKFLLRNKVKIIFGTPCFGGMLHNGFFQSMLEMSSVFTKLNIPYEVITIGNESLIQRARNGIVARFLSDEDATHLMFIDADITFSWVSIVKLLLSNKEFSGGCYPKKCFNWDKIKHQIAKNPAMKDDELMAKSLDYVFNPIYHKQGDKVVIRLENGMAQVKDIGTGFMMIKKSVFHKMIAKYPETKYRNNVAGYGKNNGNDCFYSLFDCCIDPVSKVYLSEDYLFCKRWIDIGGELWLDLNTNLNHTGIIDYKGCLALTIGEVDMLNKDAQIMRAQAAASAATNAATTATSPTSVSNAASNTASTNTLSDNKDKELAGGNKKKNKKKKNKNKNKNTNITSITNSEEQDADKNTKPMETDETNSNAGNENEDDNESDSCNEEADTKIMENALEQMASGTHC